MLDVGAKGMAVLSSLELTTAILPLGSINSIVLLKRSLATGDRRTGHSGGVPHHYGLVWIVCAEVIASLTTR